MHVTAPAPEVLNCSSGLCEAATQVVVATAAGITSWRSAVFRTVSPKNQYERRPATTLCEPSAPVMLAAMALGVSLARRQTTRTDATTGKPTSNVTGGELSAGAPVV